MKVLIISNTLTNYASYKLITDEGQISKALERYAEKIDKTNVKAHLYTLEKELDIIDILNTSEEQKAYVRYLELKERFENV